jgi:hypothetical protein
MRFITIVIFCFLAFVASSQANQCIAPLLAVYDGTHDPPILVNLSYVGPEPLDSAEFHERIHLKVEVVPPNDIGDRLRLEALVTVWTPASPPAATSEVQFDEARLGIRFPFAGSNVSSCVLTTEASWTSAGKEVLNNETGLILVSSLPEAADPCATLTFGLQIQLLHRRKSDNETLEILHLSLTLPNSFNGEEECVVIQPQPQCCEMVPPSTTPTTTDNCVQPWWYWKHRAPPLLCIDPSLCGSSGQEILNTPVQRADAFIPLAHQYLAAHRNLHCGCAHPSANDTALVEEAGLLLARHCQDRPVGAAFQPGNVRRRFIELAEQLLLFNSGNGSIERCMCGRDDNYALVNLSSQADPYIELDGDLVKALGRTKGYIYRLTDGLFEHDSLTDIPTSELRPGTIAFIAISSGVVALLAIAKVIALIRRCIIRRRHLQMLFKPAAMDFNSDDQEGVQLY